MWQLKKNYGKEYMGVVRSAFLVGPDGKVTHAWPKISPKDTPTNLLAALAEQLATQGLVPIDAVPPAGVAVSCSPSALTLRQGEQQALTFTIPSPAPAGGMLIDVRTDIPESVIMPEVMVPANATSVTVDQAVARDLTLVTNNEREFRRVAGLHVESWAD